MGTTVDWYYGWMCCRRQGPVRRPRAPRAQLLPVHRGVHPHRGLQDQEWVRATRGSDTVRYFHLNTPHLHILGCKYWATLMESSTLPQRLAAGKFKNFPCKVVILRRYNRLHSSLAIVSRKQEYTIVILLDWYKFLHTAVLGDLNHTLWQNRQCF